MKLSEKSLIYKWAYLFNGSKPWPGTQVDLCRIFWRCVLRTPLIVATIALAIGLVIYGWFLLPYWQYGFKGLLIVPGIGVLCITVAWLYGQCQDYFRGREPKPKSPSIIAEFVRGVKHRYCPIVEVSE